MTKVMIIGDTHGDDQFTANLNRCARDLEVNVQVQLGDFGYGFDRNQLASIKAWLDRDESNEYYWLDGNHDQHDYIEEVILQNEPAWTSPVSHFHDRMYYCPRGSSRMIGGKRCLFLGGAFSIDKYRRKAHVSWWPQEMIRYKDIENAITNAESGNKVDVMFTHDTPPTLWIETELHRTGYKSDVDSSRNRQNVGVVVNHVRPDDLYHGHYHWRYDTPYISPDGWRTEVHGVGANVNSYGHIAHDAIMDHNFVVRDF